MNFAQMFYIGYESCPPMFPMTPEQTVKKFNEFCNILN